jgi:hypothetical protein
MDEDVTPPPQPDADLVPVFRSGEEALIALAKSLLDNEEIPYMTRGENLQNLFGVGRLGGSFNYVVGPVEFVVRAEDAARARALLDDLNAE